MIKIAFIIPFYYKWNTFANVKSNYEFLQKLGYEVNIIVKKDVENVDLNKYDLIMLNGSGSVLPHKIRIKCEKPILSIGWSDPNLFNKDHFSQGSVYCSNSYTILRWISDIPVYFYNTACDKRYHKNLHLPKVTDILVYGAGNHSFVKNRNEVVNNLREKGFKVKVFGRGWDHHKDTHPQIEGNDLINEINRAHIVLDISNKTTAWPHRIFESSACGTPVLTMNREDTHSMFAWNEIFYYNDFEEIPNVLKKLLDIKPILKYTGELAQQRCYKDHDISVRIKELDKIIKSMV